MSRGTYARIDFLALKHNLATIQKKAPDSKLWAVIKANAYGHGSLRVAQSLTEAQGFAVATFDEAVELRHGGIEKPVLLLEGCVSEEQFIDAVEHDFTVVIHQEEQVSWLNALSSRKKVKVWIKIDTGMHRVGFDPGNALSYIDTIKQHPAVVDVGLMSHFACADEPEHEFNDLQISRFKPFTELGLKCSFANSAAIWQFPVAHHQWVRSGIALYGSSPFAHMSADVMGLKPVMTLISKVIAERTIEVGESVGYGCKWKAKRKSRLATVAIGYGDGYPRHAQDGTPIWLNGQEVPLVGRVSMDMISIDVTDIDGPVMDQDVELWGANLSVDRIAAYAGTIGYELLTRVSPRVQRI